MTSLISEIPIARDAEMPPMRRSALAIHHASAKVEAADGRQHEIETQYEESAYYFNYTGHPITLVNRMGLPITLEPKAPSWKGNTLVVRKIYNFRGNSLQQLLGNLTALGDFDNQHVDQVRELIQRQVKQAGAMSFGYPYPSFVIEYNVSVDDLRRAGGSLYHHDLDLVVSMEPLRNVPTHPHSSRHIQQEGFGGTDHFREDKSLCLKLRYVSYEKDASKMYLSVLGKVFEVTPERDQPARQVRRVKDGKVTTVVAHDYMEVTYNVNHDPDVVNGRGVQRMVLSVDEAKEYFGLTPQRSQAYAFGNALKDKIEALERDNNRLKKDLADKRDEAARELAELKSRLEAESARLKADLEKITISNRREILELERGNAVLAEQLREESMRSKTHYEERSLARKDQSEMLKHIPAIVLAAVGLFAAWAKLGAAKQTA